MNSKTSLFILLLLLFASCKNAPEQPQTLEAQIDTLILADDYELALALLEKQENSAEVAALREKTHLNYGLYLEYRAADITSMRDKMNSAIQQYIYVLKLNPNNQKAVSEIEQILQIYSTFPNRKPEPVISEQLAELGFKLD